MMLFTAEQRAKLLENGRKSAASEDGSFTCPPVVKLFNPSGSATWLISELDPEDPDIAFGLCDLGFGCPELGSVRISELEALKLPLGLKIERDRGFRGTHNIGDYAKIASDAGRIIDTIPMPAKEASHDR